MAFSMAEAGMHPGCGQSYPAGIKLQRTPNCSELRRTSRGCAGKWRDGLENTEHTEHTEHKRASGPEIGRKNAQETQNETSGVMRLMRFFAADISLGRGLVPLTADPSV